MSVSDAQAKTLQSGAPRRPMSRWAVASLLLGIGICPPLSVSAIFCGIRALMAMRYRPELRGRSLAILGIIAGFLSLALFAWLAVWWNDTARRPMIDGPLAAIKAGQSGDVAQFKAWFTEAGASASDEEAASFLNALTTRYGQLSGSQQRVDLLDPEAIRRFKQPVVWYEFLFSSGSVPAMSQFILFDPVTGSRLARFAFVMIQDADAGDLVYPLSMQPEALALEPDNVQ